MSVVVAVVVYRNFCFRCSLFRILCKVKKKKSKNSELATEINVTAEVSEFK